MKIKTAIFSLLILMTATSAFAEDTKKPAAEKSIQNRQKVELMGFFLKDPKDAALPKTEFAIGLYNQAVEHFKNHDYDLARKALKDSLAYDSRNPYAYELLGEIDYLEQKLADAKTNFEKAYILNPSEGLKAKIEKTQNENQVERSLSTYREQHFIIKYQDKEQRIEGFALRELLRETYRDISKDFGYYFKHQVVVLLYDEKDFKSITNLPHWAAGVYDGKVRMPINKRGFMDQDLRALTAHEVTHAFIAAMSSGAAPAWINEGLAEYEEDKVKPSETSVFRAALKSGKLIPIDQLVGQAATASIKDALQVNLFYEQSFQLVSYMVRRYGMFRIKQVLAEFSKGKDSDNVLRNVLHISPERLEREWIASLSD